MPPASSTSRQLQSWRGDKHSRPPSSSASWFAGLLVVMLLTLLGWLLWLLLPSRLPQTHLVSIVTGETHKFSVPPIPFAHEDLAALAPPPSSYHHLHDLSRLQVAGSIRELDQSLQGLELADKDVLVVFVSAHGVCEEGTPYLLARDFDLNDTTSSRYSVAGLLDQLQPSPARTKLLVLDAGWLVSDPRLGMIVNDFPRLVAQVAAGHDDPAQWIILSSSLLQSPTVSFATQRTVFVQSLAENLWGAADLAERGGNQDGFVALDELFASMRRDCREVADATQTPLLLHCGQSVEQLTQIPQGVYLARVASPDQEAAESQSVSGDQEKSGNGKQQDADSSSVETIAAQAPDDSSGTAGTPAEDNVEAGTSAAPASAASREIAENLHGSQAASAGLARDVSDAKNQPDELATLVWEAWRLRDQLEAVPDTTGQWSPAEYAPLEWREWNTLLVDTDLRARAGAAFDQVRMASQLRAQLVGLRRLDAGDWSEASSGDRSLVIGRLLIAASRFDGSPQQATFTGDSRELVEVANAVRYCRRLSFRFPRYLQVHGEIVTRWPDCPQLEDYTRQLERLADGVEQFEAELASRDGQRLVSSSAEDPLLERSRELRETEQEIQRQLELVLDTLAAHPDQPVNRTCMAGLLRTPLWTVQQRKRLVECLARPLAADRGGSPDTPLLSQRWSVTDSQWERLAWHIQLQARLFQMAGAAGADTLNAQLQEFDEARRLAAVENSQPWGQLEQLGETCQSLYVSMYQQVREQNLALAARYVDGRDASRLAVSSEQRDCFPELRLLPPRRPDRIDVVQNPAGTIPIGNEAVLVELEFRPSNPDVRSLSVIPEFDDQKLDLKLADRDEVIRSNRPENLQVGADRAVRLRLLIKTAPGQAEELSGGQHPVELRVQAGTLSLRHTIPCAVPKPNEVDLFIERVETRDRARQFGRDGTELRPLVNRTTYFRMLLADLSGQGKQVDVALYRIPRSDWVPGRLMDEYGEPFTELRSWLFQTNSDQLLPGVEPIARTAQPLRLPADARPQNVDLSPPPAPPSAAAAPESSADASPSEASTPAAPAPIDISYGLACVITNVENTNERWVKWIEVNPLTPRQYVLPQVVYDPDLKRISITVRGLDSDGDGSPDQLPGRADLVRQPIEIFWDTAGVVPSGAERNDRAVLDRPDAEATLSASVPAHPTRSAIIRLHVDGYPRAFLYELALNRQNEGRDIRRDERAIRLISLQMRDENRVFRTREMEQEPEGASGENEFDVGYLRPEMPATFAVPGKSDDLLVGFEVDAPLDAFARRDRGDVIEIGFTRAGFEPVRLYADRHMQAWLQEVTPQGFAVATRLGDYSAERAVPLSVAGLKNARLRIRARLSVEQDDPPPHELDLVLDGEDPVLESLAVPAMVRQGQPLPVSVDIVDLSGPAKVIVGVIKRRADALQEEQATIRDQFVPTAIGDRWPVAVSLDSAKLEAGEYFVKVVVSDRVGKQSESVTPITIGMPLPSGADMPRELRGTVRGTVRFGPRFRPDRITVRLVGSDREPALTANGGRFQFDDVPAGSYTLEARGPVRGYIKQGRTQIELKTKEDFERQITIDLTEADD